VSEVRDEILAANAIYSGAFGDETRLALPPARRFAILTCMDARLDPAKYDVGVADSNPVTPTIDFIGFFYHHLLTVPGILEAHR
jgi:hypothetical protein